MKKDIPEKTTLSSKGQVVLPKSVREGRLWGPGTVFTVEDAGNGILLRPAKLFPRTTLEDLKKFHYKDKPKTLAEMASAIGKTIEDRRARGRY